MTTNPLISELKGRELIAQMSGDHNALSDHLNSSPRTVYCGFDPTADSLHIGHLVPLLMLKRFQQAGHKPVALIGGATGMIGDPSFKATERSLNSVDVVDQWIEKIGRQLAQFIDFDCGENSAFMTNNRDWMGNMNIMTFLRDIGKHFSVNAMIGKESVRQRIERPEQGISFTEFSYSLLQSYDFAMLNRDHSCSIQIGGNDQWGNITAGIDLTRRLNKQQVYGMTLPLITKSDGTKFGKTESGAVWLDPAKTSPYAFYQFWINTSDDDVYRFLRFYTFLSLKEISAIEMEDRNSSSKPKAQTVLAEQMTRLVHGGVALNQVKQISATLFSGDARALSREEFGQLELDGMPCSKLGEEQTITDVLVACGLAGSRRIAREHINAGAIMLNGDVVTDCDLELLPSRSLHNRYFLIRRGKKQFHLLFH